MSPREGVGGQFEKGEEKGDLHRVLFLLRNFVCFFESFCFVVLSVAPLECCTVTVERRETRGCRLQRVYMCHGDDDDCLPHHGP